MFRRSFRLPHVQRFMHDLVIVTGSRNWTDRDAIDASLNLAQAASHANGRTLVVMHGGASGADSLADLWCRTRRFVDLDPASPSGSHVRLSRHPGRVIIRRADWAFYGKRAGYVRNAEMVTIARRPSWASVSVLAFPLGESRGTQMMMTLCEKAGLKVTEPSLEPSIERCTKL
jgi:hypothetical protein